MIEYFLRIVGCGHILSTADSHEENEIVEAVNAEVRHYLNDFDTIDNSVRRDGQITSLLLTNSKYHGQDSNWYDTSICVIWRGNRSTRQTYINGKWR